MRPSTFPPARVLAAAAALAALLLPVAAPTPAADARAGADMGIQLRVLPDCTARANAEGCLQPALQADGDAETPNRISGLSPPRPVATDDDGAQVVTRTW